MKCLFSLLDDVDTQEEVNLEVAVDVANASSYSQYLDNDDDYVI
jgi:hypothetical protein